MKLAKSIEALLLAKGWQVRRRDGQVVYRCPRVFTYHSLGAAVRIQCYREESAKVTHHENEHV